jgi:UDP-glucuronate decarboxylase
MSNILESDINEIVEGIQPLASDLAGKTVLITGGRGFLGRYFTEALVKLNKTLEKNPVRIVSLDNFITAGKFGHEALSDVNYKFIEHDIIQPLKIDEKVDYILHCAGIASPFYYRAHPLKTLDVAVTGLRNMLDLAARDHARILFFSSSEIYGDPDPKYVPTDENYRGNVSCLGPRACYDESKRLGETLCRIYHTELGVKTNMVRPFNVYGPGMQEKDYRVLPNFASRIKGNLPIKVYGTGNQTRTFCYITDAIVGFFRALVKGVPGEPYNIGNPSPEVSMMELVKHIEGVLRKPLKVDVVNYPDSYPADEPNRRCPDIKKASLQLGYEPKVSLDDGLGRFLRWADQTYVGEV